MHNLRKSVYLLARFLGKLPIINTLPIKKGELIE